MTKVSFDSVTALIVEDNRHMRSLLRALLQAFGIKSIFEASNGTEAMVQLRNRHPDLILADLAMAPVNGIEFTLQVRQAPDSPNPYVPIIMVTGHTERERVEAARDAGVTELLAKPVTAHNLYQRISEIVDRPRAFVKSPDYFGPDRRRRHAKNYSGPFRRREELADVEIR
jgi:CheY-like chemotaxis protein